MDIALNILGATASVALAGGFAAATRARRAALKASSKEGAKSAETKAGPLAGTARFCAAAAAGALAGVGIATVNPGTVPGIAPAFCGLLAASAAFDFETRTIPLELLGAMVAFGVLGCPSGILTGIIAAIAAAAVTYAASMVGAKACGKDVFGLGDVLLVAAIAPMVAGGATSIRAALAVLTVELLAVLLWMKKTGNDHFAPFAPLALLPVACALLVG